MEEIAVVVDSNVVFAAIIREGGLNRYVVTIIPAIMPFYCPKGLREEIIRHSGEISKKTKMPADIIASILERLLSTMQEVEVPKSILEEAKKYVTDEADSPFVGVALLLKERYKRVVILTWNIRDYLEEKLAKDGIFVTTPPEFLRRLRDDWGGKP